MCGGTRGRITYDVDMYEVIDFEPGDIQGHACVCAKCAERLWQMLRLEGRTMPEELKPCPFCWSEAEMRKTSTSDYFVRCTKKDCAARTRQHHENENGAILRWNERAERTCTVEHYSPDDGYDEPEHYSLSCGHRFMWCDADKPAYCPACGAKVVW